MQSNNSSINRKLTLLRITWCRSGTRSEKGNRMLIFCMISGFLTSMVSSCLKGLREGLMFRGLGCQKSLVKRWLRKLFINRHWCGTQIISIRSGSTALRIRRLLLPLLIRYFCFFKRVINVYQNDL